MGIETSRFSETNTLADTPVDPAALLNFSPDAAAHIYQASKPRRLPCWHLYPRVVAGLAAAALLMGQSSDFGDTTEAAAATPPSGRSVELSTGKNPLPKCLPNQQINLTLVKRNNSRPGQQALAFKAKSCKKTTPNILTNVRLTEAVIEPGQREKKKGWSFKKFPPAEIKQRNFSVGLPAKSSSTTSKPENSQTIILKAESTKGKRRKQLGKRMYKLVNGLPYPVVSPGDLTVPKDCHPDPDFKTGVFDDNAFAAQKARPREQAFDAAEAVFGAKAIRLSFNSGMLEKYGMEAFEGHMAAIEEANKRGMEVYVSLMATPAYNPDLGQSLNYQNLDPSHTYVFANKIALDILRRGLKVKLFYIHNEPNHPLFNASQSMSLYNNMFYAGLRGVRDADPNAQVVPAGLAPDIARDLNPWVENNSALPGDGVAIHPYGNGINRLQETITRAKGKPVYISEYGNQANDPEQMTKNAQAIITAKCAGVRALIFMQLYRYSYIKSWNTGVLDAPNSTNTR